MNNYKVEIEEFENEPANEGVRNHYYIVIKSDKLDDDGYNIFYVNDEISSLIKSDYLTIAKENNATITDVPNWQNLKDITFTKLEDAKRVQKIITKQLTN